MPLTPTAPTYSKLLTQVRKTLVEGQATIERERVRTYWQTGKHIYDHILEHQDRADYGAQIFKKLERDLNISQRLLERCVQFTKTYPRFSIAASRPQFKWSHYRELIAISDPKKRDAVEKEALENDWTSDELAARLRNKTAAPASKAPVDNAPLTVACGTPYSYQVVQRTNLKTGKTALRLDLGFGVFLNDRALIGSLLPGEIVESRQKDDDNYKLTKGTRTPKDLYTYWAEIERVIDGDTVKVRFDLGFNTEIRQTLRLAALDCPEIDTKEGQAAKIFTQSYLKEEAFVIVHTKRSDKYDRYLADIFIPQTEAISFATRDDILKNSLYLNNLLLKEGYAERWEG